MPRADEMMATGLIGARIAQIKGRLLLAATSGRAVALMEKRYAQLSDRQQSR
jgi:hypothetical protein